MPDYLKIQSNSSRKYRKCTVKAGLNRLSKIGAPRIQNAREWIALIIKTWFRTKWDTNGGIYTIQHTGTVKTVISGSYRKYFAQMIEVKKFLELERIHVLAPVSAGVVNPGEEFIILDEDPLVDPRVLQDSILAKIRTSSFLILANVGGYIGKAAVFEMGHAVSQGIQILTLEPVEDPNLAGYCRLLREVFPKWHPHSLALETTP